jgi:hypothetical protein
MGKILKRLAWRWNNLTFREFFDSYFPEEVWLPDQNMCKYDDLVKNSIKPDTCPKEGNPFVMIKPSGMPLEEQIKHFIKFNGIEIKEEHEISDYVALAAGIYRFKPRTGAEIPQNYFWLAFEDMKMQHRTKCLVLDKNSVDLSNPHDFKIPLRHVLGPIKFYRIHYYGQSDVAFTSFVHVPDKEDLDREYSVLRNYLEAQNERH